MKVKIIAIAAAIAVCTALTGCTENQSEPVIETTAAASLSEISETLETTETTSAATVRTTAEIEDTTVSETSETVRTAAVPKVELSDLKAIYGEKLYFTPECKIIEDIMCEDEADFPSPEHIALARKTAFADEKCREDIARYNEEAADERDFVRVEAEEDLPFEMGASYDFDGDGENESVVSLDLSPAPTWFWGDGAIYYIDGDNIFCVTAGYGASTRCSVRAFDFGAKTFIEIDTYAGATTMVSVIYCTDNGTLEPVAYSGGTGWVDYLDGVFYYTIKYDFAQYPIVFCEDGKFRQLGIKEITEDDFAAHLENGREYLDCLKSEKNVTSIYTMGYCRYQINFDDDFFVFYIDENGNAVKTAMPSKFQDRELTEEIDYDIDISKLDVIPYDE